MDQDLYEQMFGTGFETNLQNNIYFQGAPNPYALDAYTSTSASEPEHLIGKDRETLNFSQSVQQGTTEIFKLFPIPPQKIVIMRKPQNDIVVWPNEHEALFQACSNLGKGEGASLNPEASVSLSFRNDIYTIKQGNNSWNINEDHEAFKACAEHLPHTHAYVIPVHKAKQHAVDIPITDSQFKNYVRDNFHLLNYNDENTTLSIRRAPGTGHGYACEYEMSIGNDKKIISQHDDIYSKCEQRLEREAWKKIEEVDLSGTLKVQPGTLAKYEKDLSELGLPTNDTLILKKDPENPLKILIYDSKGDPVVDSSAQQRALHPYSASTITLEDFTHDTFETYVRDHYKAVEALNRRLPAINHDQDDIEVDPNHPVNNPNMQEKTFLDLETTMYGKGVHKLAQAANFPKALTLLYNPQRPTIGFIIPHNKHDENPKIDKWGDKIELKFDQMDFTKERNKNLVKQFANFFPRVKDFIPKEQEKDPIQH